MELEQQEQQLELALVVAALIGHGPIDYMLEQMLFKLQLLRIALLVGSLRPPTGSRCMAGSLPLAVPAPLVEQRSVPSLAPASHLDTRIE